jgi:hypothetical protein
MEDRRGEHGIGAAELDAVDQVLQRADAARGDHRHVHRIRDHARELEVEAAPHAVAIHARQENLARSARGDFHGPLDGVDARGCTAAVDVHLPGVDRVLLHVDRGDDALRAEMARRLVEELRVVHAGRVDADLVGAGVEQRADVGDRIDPAAHGERDEHLVRHLLDHVVQQAALVHARADVQEGELVRALLVVAARDLHRVAGVAEVDEIDALHDAPFGDVEAGNDALG